MNFSKETAPNYLDRVRAALTLAIALGIASLGAYAVYCFMTKFGE
jgi:hypothetical protein